MSTSEWDDFQGPSSNPPKKAEEITDRRTPDNVCVWGQADVEDDCQPDSSVSSEFITLYEQYLNDKKSLAQKVCSNKSYTRDPQKELRKWFDDQGQEFEPTIERTASGHFVCSIDLPVGDQYFTLTSESYANRKGAIDEVCLDACRMLDYYSLLGTEGSAQIGKDEELARKRRIAEARKDDDIEYDQTSDSKRHCLSSNQSGLVSSSSNSTNNQVNTYDSLMKKWTALNMSILQTKAKLAKLDLSITTKQQQQEQPARMSTEEEDDNPQDSNKLDSVTDGDNDDEIDPLDEFMSNLNTKTKMSMDDKIEKSRLKVQIATYERQQEEVAKLLELAKPSSSTKGPVGNNSKR